MSVPLSIDPRAHLTLTERCTARCCVAAARLLARRSPRTICRVLDRVRRGARPATAPDALRARHAVVTVNARCTGQGCLQRSLATALLCRTRGRWPQWCTGVRTEPFRARAWVAVDGHPIGEPDDTRLYQPLLSIPR
ncbi:lasso peptide biosynthesis B2 protein [Streptomyces halobius]|uniref:Lasso peptide biosynthesis B2 protein n=1 Tax=Streptomyces halobius TaxID=2879846 RepID=A0ABY4MDH1_9ACTN|nr:lasso peptide biosynthesis B2 protein [Streptomyces halobius]UQA95158.1 lasso peptide biosynthesis B2 protein [Streptomyces halobius]